MSYVTGMPRKKESLIRQFFKFDPEKCQSMCLITEEKTCLDNPSVIEVKSCRTTIASDHASNLERHVRTCHAETYRKYTEEKQKGMNRSSSTQSKLEGYGFCNKMNSIADALVEIVTVNGRSFDMIQDSGFKKILEPILRNVNFSLEDIKIEKFVSMKANMIREKIIRAINNKLISIKIDHVKRLNRSFLGINIQLYENGKLNNYVIAVIELEKARNVESMKTIICQELNRFHISMEQIYTITTDNAADHISFFDDCLNTEGEDDDEEGYEEEFDPMDEEEGMEYEIFDDEMKDEIISNVKIESERANSVSCDSDETQMLLDELCKDLSPDISPDEPLNPTNIVSNGTRCAEHTLQQAISETLEESKLEAIDAARHIVKKLKTRRVMMALKSFLLEEPLLDSPMRWMSTYDMLIRLFEIEGTCYDTEVKDEYLNMSHEHWLTLSTVVEALKPCRRATLQLQKDVTLTDIYKVYSICIMELTKMSTEFALLLARNLEVNIQVLFTNLPFISAMFLDPRFTVTLQDSCKEEAIRHLISVYKKMSELHKSSSYSLVDTAASSGGSISDDGMDEFESILENCENLNRNKKLKRETDHLESLLRSFGSQPRLNSKEIITQFWETNKMTYPELYKLACVLFQVHGSQLSVRKLFSHLSFLSDPSHPKISSSLFNDVMVVRINFDVDGAK